MLRRRVELHYAADPSSGYATHLAAALDYRTWHEVSVTILGPDTGQQRRLSRRAKLSQGETRFVSYVTLFAAADGYLTSLGDDGRALRLILLDDAFAKVDDTTVAELMGLLVTLDLDFVMTGPRAVGLFPAGAGARCVRGPAQRRQLGGDHARALGRSQPPPAQHGMTALPSALHDHLAAPSLAPMWAVLRERLERTGHAIRGTMVIELDDDGADRLGGLLGRSLERGTCRVRLPDLDAALRTSAAGRGLVAVVAELTGAALRDRPAERVESQVGREQLWAHLDELLVAAGLADQEWVTPWTDWLHRGGVLTRLPASAAEPTLSVAVRVIAAVLAADRAPRSLAELATEHTGTAHGLDDGAPAAALALRGLAFALQALPPASAAERRALWQRVGISTDEISGTVLVWALRPPGADRWSAMMRERADLGLITHLTVHELQRARTLTSPGEVVHACENPQVLQQLAAAGVDRPVICTSGNPAAAGSLLLDRVTVSLPRRLRLAGHRHRAADHHPRRYPVASGARRLPRGGGAAAGRPSPRADRSRRDDAVGCATADRHDRDGRRRP